MGEGTVVSRLPVSDLKVLQDLDWENPELLQPALTALLELHADRFDPIRFRYIQVLAQKALKQRPTVARVLKKKALQALRDYLAAYIPARDHAASLVTLAASGAPDTIGRFGQLFDAGDFKELERLAARVDAQGHGKQGLLSALTRAMLQSGEFGDAAPKPSFEGELRQQELAFMQAVEAGTPGSVGGPGEEQEPSNAGEFSVMRRFRESLVQRNSERRVEQAIKKGPENPGPLNAQALVIRSLSLMRDLSPAYANRLVSYMETLIWLEQAGAALATAKSRASGRRKS